MNETWSKDQKIFTVKITKYCVNISLCIVILLSNSYLIQARHQRRSQVFPSDTVHKTAINNLGLQKKIRFILCCKNFNTLFSANITNVFETG